MIVKNNGQTQNDGQKNSGQYADTSKRKTRKLINVVFTRRKSGRKTQFT